ncbi:MAG: hypothetical protein E7439_06855 [Ruminococcaceae bacterium]|nr:hypothetical protein [Oscillospiraceae bacterium]
MYCIKCGRKEKGKRVFCQECLDIMEQYPVKPGTPIQLPTYTPPAPPAKASRRRPKKPEEQIRRLRSNLRWMTCAFVLALLAFLLAATMIFWMLKSGSYQPPFRSGLPF